MERVILTGRVLQGKNLVGAKFISLDTYDIRFIRRRDFPSLFKNYDVVNCKLTSDNSLRCTNKHYSLSMLPIYSEKGRRVKYGCYKDSGLIARELHIHPDLVAIRICGALVAGAITDPDSKRALDHADLYYDEIRSMSGDVNRIAENLNLSIDIIRQIKDYLFYNTQNLDGEYRRFDADFAIAQSWQRLMSKDIRDIKPHDRTLILHEIYEKKLVQDGMSQHDAHIETSKLYDYKKEASEYYDKIRKYKQKR